MSGYWIVQYHSTASGSTLSRGNFYVIWPVAEQISQSGKKCILCQGSSSRYAVCTAQNTGYKVHAYVSTGLPAYSDSFWTAKKCHCKRGASYCVTVSRLFFCMKVQLGAQNSVTVRWELLTESL